MTKTIMLIHGAWLNASSWENWKAHYEAKGFRVVAPNWPHDERSPAELRVNPHPDMKNIGFKRIVDSYEAEIWRLPEEPILMGHSAGAVFVQTLLDRRLGVAGVSIDPAPTTGVPLGPHSIVSAFPVLGSLGSWGRVMRMSRKFFATRFAQTIPTRAEADELYDRYIVPTPGKLYWDGILTKLGKIRWDNPYRAPLLLIGGGADLIADASMTRSIYDHQKRAASKTELHIFPDRSHWTCMDPGWEEVANLALDWSLKNMRKPAELALPTNVS
ncbi:alpha/beta hydrolase [Devosia sp. ZW T5_3]|uniref:alpha/beta hydrolase n=1 Tax=Devosia sp. ZW T5_3 TaxID=3378085 RepID=UPI00385191B1